jgi:hypothetical protein
MEQAATTKVPIGAPCGKASWFGRSVARSVPRAWGSVARSPCRRPGAPDGRKAFCVSARDRGVRRVGRRNSARQEVGSGEASWRVYQRREQKLIGQRPCSGALPGSSWYCIEPRVAEGRAPACRTVRLASWNQWSMADSSRHRATPLLGPSLTVFPIHDVSSSIADRPEAPNTGKIGPRKHAANS